MLFCLRLRRNQHAVNAPRVHGQLVRLFAMSTPISTLSRQCRSDFFFAPWSHPSTEPPQVPAAEVSRDVTRQTHHCTSLIARSCRLAECFLCMEANQALCAPRRGNEEARRQRGRERERGAESTPSIIWSRGFMPCLDKMAKGTETPG